MDERRRLARAYAEMTGGEAVAARWAATPGQARLHAEREAAIRQALPPLPPGPVLELGAGSGGGIPLLRSVLPGRPVLAVDLLHERVVGLAAADSGAVPVVADARRLPLRDGAVAAVAAMTLFSSVLDDRVRAAIASEVVRVLAPGGAVLWYDMRWARPDSRHVRPVRRAQLAALFPALDVAVRPVTFPPPLSRAAARLPAGLRRVVVALPLRSHLAGALVRRQPAADGPAS